MNKMISGLNNKTNFTYTENNGIARKTTNSDVLDFFSMGGTNDSLILFDKAWNENSKLTLKLMFYFRDIRGGQGRRESFRKQLVHLSNLDAEVLVNNLHLIPEYGRWDDLYSLFGTELEIYVLDLFRKQIIVDMDDMKNGNNISLLAKWLKSENASSKETKRLARITRKSFGLSSKKYRQMLSEMRAYLNIVESKITNNDWDKIDYTKVPSNAMMKYRFAFSIHDSKRFKKYVNLAKQGKIKINSGTLYPYEIVEKILNDKIDPKLAQAQWSQLPNYIKGNTENSMAVVDVSASMYGMPMNVSISIGMYLAERCKGEYANHFITFSEKPKLVKIQGTDISSRVENMRDTHWGFNTDIEAVFDLILDVAIEKNLTQDELLDKLYIISDMEFDKVDDNNDTVMQTINNKFTEAGYKMPKLVFWNVDVKNVQVPMSMDDRNFQNVSGFSPSIFKYVMKDEFLSAYDLMLDVTNSDRYKPVKV